MPTCINLYLHIYIYIGNIYKQILVMVMSQPGFGCVYVANNSMRGNLYMFSTCLCHIFIMYPCLDMYVYLYHYM